MANYMSDFDSSIIDAIYDLMLRYFRNNVSYIAPIAFNYEVNLYNKEWKYDKIGRVLYNYIHLEDDDIEIKIGLSKNYNSYFIMSDAKGGGSVEVKSKANSLGGIVDNITEDILNIEDNLYKEIENGFLI